MARPRRRPHPACSSATPPAAAPISKVDTRRAPRRWRHRAMTDLLLDVAQNPSARALIKSLGLPIPLPERLEREPGPWTAAPLRDRSVLVGATPGAALGSTIAECLAPAGADSFVDGGDDRLAPFAAPGETFG